MAAVLLAFDTSTEVMAVALAVAGRDGRADAPAAAGGVPDSVAAGEVRTRAPGGDVRTIGPGGEFHSSVPGGDFRVNAPGGDFRVNAPGGALASATLLPCIESLLAEAGVAWAAVDGIGYGRGPGAFTGLRTACAVAQGLGFALGRPVLPVDSLLIVAEDARLQAGAEDGFELWVAMDARMGEVYAGAYRRAGGHWQCRSAPALYTLDALHRAWAAAPPAAVAGSALAAFGERLATGAAACWPCEADRAGALLRCTQALWSAGAGVDAAAALPLYLRDKVALTTAERHALKAVP
jgi:tRNA threonylcarbamoyladenosine biosynthesis protein TsaB